MADSLESQIMGIVQSALRDGGSDPDVTVTSHDSMETLTAWDSLSFMRVFLAINEVFGISPDFDDAIHYTSVQGLHNYLQEKLV